MNREAFYAALRRRDSGVFGTSLSPAQATGTEAIIDACVRYGMSNAHHVANVLAQVYHETGGYMLPIKETVFPSHTNKNPTDATVVARLDNAFAKGQLTWVKTPYWRPDAQGKSWFGRGPIQLTHKVNYEKMGRRLGVDLVSDPNRALDPRIGADIAVVGMAEGMFTGRKLGDYAFPSALNAASANHPRRIVNGPDGADTTVAGYHRAFHAAIVEGGGWRAGAPASQPSPAPSLTYTVRSGDTLGKIAFEHGTTVMAIVTLNGIADPNRISVGQVLRLPQKPQDAQPDPAPPQPTPEPPKAATPGLIVLIGGVIAAVVALASAVGIDVRDFLP